LIKFYKNDGLKLKTLDEIEQGCWVHLENPTQAELVEVIEQTKVNPDFLYAALDEEEMPRIERDDGQTLVVVNVVNENFHKELNMYYDTIPLGIILLPDYFITIGKEATACVNFLVNKEIRVVSTARKNKLLIQLLYQMSKEYLKALQMIDKVSLEMEAYLNQSADNKTVRDLYSLEKTLVYFKSSIRANESVIKKINRYSWIHEYEEDTDLLEDTLIEIAQASDMSDINVNILIELREAFAIVMSNNLNITMKVLASLTIVLTVPNMIFGFYGINTNLDELPHILQFTHSVVVLAIALTLIIYIVLKRKDLL